ncbi:hypothetical protein DM860_004962 [Cuscuta australis]|uniref:OTU domain-containing protein n=1 Tax=Cuscuta australis TaxID=267555 RepID=A0A328DRS9_9ASTE|nr:hypothetical protein DM860_004962 [Cuscuta australis]
MGYPQFPRHCRIVVDKDAKEVLLKSIKFPRPLTLSDYLFNVRKIIHNIYIAIAVADQLEGDEDEHAKYRSMVVKYIRRNRETFEPFIEDDIPFVEYCESMEKDGTWAGHMELPAASLVTNSNICIHQQKNHSQTVKVSTKAVGNVLQSQSVKMVMSGSGCEDTFQENQSERVRGRESKRAGFSLANADVSLQALVEIDAEFHFMFSDIISYIRDGLINSMVKTARGCKTIDQAANKDRHLGVISTTSYQTGEIHKKIAGTGDLGATANLRRRIIAEVLTPAYLLPLDMAGNRRMIMIIRMATLIGQRFMGEKQKEWKYVKVKYDSSRCALPTHILGDVMDANGELILFGEGAILMCHYINQCDM